METPESGETAPTPESTSIFDRVATGHSTTQGGRRLGDCNASSSECPKEILVADVVRTPDVGTKFLVGCQEGGCCSPLQLATTEQHNNEHNNKATVEQRNDETKPSGPYRCTARDNAAGNHSSESKSVKL